MLSADKETKIDPKKFANVKYKTERETNKTRERKKIQKCERNAPVGQRKSKNSLSRVIPFEKFSSSFVLCCLITYTFVNN